MRILLKTWWVQFLWLRIRRPTAEKITRLNALKEQPARCAMDKELRDLTQIYRDKQDNNPLLRRHRRFTPSLMLCAVNIQQEIKVETRGHQKSSRKNITSSFTKNSELYRVWPGTFLIYHELPSPWRFLETVPLRCSRQPTSWWQFKWFQKLGMVRFINIVISGVKWEPMSN